MKRFNFAKGKDYELKEVIDDADLPLQWEWDKGDCPHCNQRIRVVKDYTIGKLEIYESDGDIEMIGYTKELIDDNPLTMRLPNSKFWNTKDMTEDVKQKSKYLKDKL